MASVDLGGDAVRFRDVPVVRGTQLPARLGNLSVGGGCRVGGDPQHLGKREGHQRYSSCRRSIITRSVMSACRRARAAARMRVQQAMAIASRAARAIGRTSEAKSAASIVVSFIGASVVGAANVFR